ncbi:MAG: hypothetical protein JSW50_04425 [Candidatus Latescibacterota bacterium]|nr:MAG: hypothetical protein JSW50_04425 [Candidatus Latescibacterota bacterium]
MTRSVARVHLWSAAFVVIAGCMIGAGCSDLPSGPADTSEMLVRGVTLADWSTTGYDSPSSVASIQRFAGMGVNLVTILVTVYQTDVNASEIRIDPRRTPSDISVANAALRVKAQNPPMRVGLKFHIDVDDGSWRGNIAPSDPAQWFDQYEEYIVGWARQAEGLGVEHFVVATELAGTLEHESRWRDVIQEVRKVYSGAVIYAASWDEAPKVPFWDALDFVGVNFYAPVSNRTQTNRIDILAAWQPWLSRLRLLHKQAGRKILLTEVGYRSIDGAGMHPYDFDRDAAVDYEEQADLYWGALEAVGKSIWVEGVYLWNWLADSEGFDASKDYTPEGKLAEAELVGSWGG